MGKKNYDETYQRHAVSLVESGISKAQVARDLNISAHLIYSWCKKYSVGTTIDGSTSGNHEEVVRLRKQLERAQAELDILKKAVSIFSRPSK
jgi:transposase